MIRALLLAILGTASFAAVYVGMAPPGQPPPLRSTDGEMSGAAPVAFELRARADEPEIRPVRDVTPDTMTAGPPVTGALTRIAAARNEAPEPQGARLERLFNPIVVSAGVIKAGDRRIRLAGIAAPDFDARCGEGAAAWPCGRVARAALRRFIRGRAIECEAPTDAEAAPAAPAAARCAVGGEDISRWLVAHGWARSEGEPLAEAERTARKKKLGLWGGNPSESQAGAGTSSG